MRPLTDHDIDAGLEALSAMQERDMDTLMRRMSKEQPFLQIYIASICERGDFNDENDADVFAMIAFDIWYLMREAADGPLSVIEGEDIDHYEQQMDDLLRHAEGVSEADWLSMISKWIKGYNQTALLQYIIEVIASPENPYGITQEGADLMLVFLKTIIDCLDHAEIRQGTACAGEDSNTAGRCALCHELVRKGDIKEHVQACIEHDQTQVGKRVTMFHLLIEGADLPEYWLYVAIPASRTLEDLDMFLRDIWLECCGHLSCFTINNQRYSSLPDDDLFSRTREKTMNQKLYNVLGPGITFQHEYDFGSTTELTLHVVDIPKGYIGKSPVVVFARNEPPAWTCSQCDKPATWIMSGGWGIDPDDLFCDECVSDEDEEMCLPLVNSPRTGTCGYSG